MSHFKYHAKYKLLHSPSTDYADWNNNYCTFAPDSGVYFNFKDACRRHDYGYRNWPHYHAATYANRLMIDQVMLKDMKNWCSSTYSSWWSKPARYACTETAYYYYGAVRRLGGWFF